MSEMKLYTAAGRFVHKRDSNGQTYPIIILGSRDYLVDPQEFMIWINANWRISKWEEIGKECTHIFEKFSENMQKSVDNPDVQSLVKEWQDFISTNFYKCTNEILKSLGQTYIKDVRFKNNIDKYGEGLSEFISNAIEFYCNRNLTA